MEVAFNTHLNMKMASGQTLQSKQSAVSQPFPLIEVYAKHQNIRYDFGYGKGQLK
jgi:hypothetical protein